MSNSTDSFFDSKVLGHPSGLFVLFFTEMWERFSYYGMRALLILFFTAAIIGDGSGGWGWPREHAYAIFGTYTSLVYLSTLLGGYFADKVIGFRWAVVVGASLMTIGHACMALETPFFIYSGLVFLVFGSGFFKPNMTSMISELYKDHPEKKDGAYTIFYMGVNSGAFLGILLCGYLGEMVGWRFGFGLAGIFMLFGLLQFWWAQDIFGKVGLKPKREVANAIPEDGDKRNPFQAWQLAIIGVCSALGLLWVINDPVSKISGGATNFLNFKVGELEGPDFTILLALGLFLFLLIYRLFFYSKVTRERMIAVIFFSIITMFFWAVFEQSPSSLTIFANDYTNRVLEGTAGMTFKIVNSLMTLIPLGIITWVLVMLFKQTFGRFPLSNVTLGTSFVIIWGIAIWMLAREFQKDVSEVPASWFGVLNSLYIITFAPLFSKWWESKYNPTANMKYALGMVLLGLGMVCVAYGSRNIPVGAETASVSMIWLILVYLFHTLGELCISPVGLSYVSKLVPGRMIALMFGIYYLAIAIGMKMAGIFAEMSEPIAAEKGISHFFWILTGVSFALALFAVVTGPLTRKLMHGVR